MLVGRLRDMGLMQKFMLDSLNNRLFVKYKQENELKKLGLDVFTGPFIFWFSGISVSLVVFIMEWRFGCNYKY